VHKDSDVWVYALEFEMLKSSNKSKRKDSDKTVQGFHVAIA
jgi:hypothetical protein